MWLTSWTACTPTIIIYTSESLCTYIKWMMFVQEKYKLQIQKPTNQKTGKTTTMSNILSWRALVMVWHLIILLSFWFCPIYTVISWAQCSVSETESLMSLSKRVCRYNTAGHIEKGLSQFSDIVSVSWTVLVSIPSFPEDRNGTCWWILDNEQCSGTQ